MRTGSRIILLVIGVVDVACILFHVHGVQQTRFWAWPWRRGPVWPLYPAMVLTALPLIAAVRGWARGMRPRIALALVSLSLLVMPAVGLVLAYRPTTVLFPAMVVEDRAASSYWSDARRLSRQGLSATQVLSQYPHWLPYLYVHTRNKPPGFVMFYFGLLQLLGRNSHASAVVGAVIIAMVTAAGVPAVFALGRALTGSRDAAFWAAVLLALTPSLVAIYPQFDSCFPAVVCVTALLWLRGVRGSAWCAAGFGLLLAVSLFCTSNLLVLGTFYLALAVWDARSGDLAEAGGAMGRFARAGAVAAATLVGFYLLLWVATGYNPITTMRTYVALERAFETVVSPRPWPQIVPSDFYLFFFGTGHLLPLLAAGAVIAAGADRAHGRRVWALRICVLQILLVGCTGLLRGETTRYWCFLLPLLLIPAADALTHWPPRWRLTAVALVGLLMLAMVQNVEFNSFALQ